MLRSRLPARVAPLVRTIGPYAWIAAGLVAGAWLAYGWLQRTRTLAGVGEEHSVSQWETDGGVVQPGQRAS